MKRLSLLGRTLARFFERWNFIELLAVGLLITALLTRWGLQCVTSMF